MYDEFDDDCFLGPEALSSLHFDAGWEIDDPEPMAGDEFTARSLFALGSSELDRPEDESSADLACAEELRKAHRMLFPDIS
jgi:hypothetical protein